MPLLDVNGLDLCYETSGDPTHPPVVLIAGLGVQLIDWPDHFVDPLVEAGHYVVRFDNRDIGLSTTYADGASDPQRVLDALLAGEDPGVAYRLGDMAGDVAGLLDGLEIESAHVVGVSMGGMIAQAMAIDHPAKVRSLTSIMSTTGAPDVGQPTSAALEAILAPAPGTDRRDVIEQNLESARIWASPGHFDVDRMRRLFEHAWDRVGGPQGENTGRHFCAIIASEPRDEALGSLPMPSLVVHGTADTLITPSGGERTAACIPNAELLLIDGMGHDLVPAFAPMIIDAIAQVVATTTSD